MDGKKRKRKPNPCGGGDKTVRIQLSIDERQIAYLKRKKIYSPSKILRAAIDKLMENDP